MVSYSCDFQTNSKWYAEKYNPELKLSKQEATLLLSGFAANPESLKFKVSGR